MVFPRWSLVKTAKSTAWVDSSFYNYVCEAYGKFLGLAEFASSCNSDTFYETPSEAERTLSVGTSTLSKEALRATLVCA